MTRRIATALSVAVVLMAGCADKNAKNPDQSGVKVDQSAVTAQTTAEQKAAQTPAAATPAERQVAGAPEQKTPATDASGKPIGSTGTNPVARLFGNAPKYREVTIPAGTVLPVDLETPVASDTSRVEQAVRGTLRRAIILNGVEVLPAGTAVTGNVTAARRPGKVKGRGYIAMRFNELDTPGEGMTKISTATVSHTAPATKQKDTLKIVAPAAGGAVLGRIVGGKGGARKGAVIGGAAGTGYVLSTRGEEARLGKGANLSVKLTAPVTVRLREK